MSVIDGIVVSAGAVAEMGWAIAYFNSTGVWNKDVVLGKATAAVVADISKLVSSSSNSKVYKLFQTFFHSNIIYFIAGSQTHHFICKGLIKVFIYFQGIEDLFQTSFCHFAILPILSCTSQLHIFVCKFSQKCF